VHSTTDDSRLTVPADTESLSGVRHHVRVTASELGAPEGLVDELVLAASELATNVIMHTDDEYLSVCVAVDERSCIIEVSGADALVEPTERPLPDPCEIGGRGLFLVTALMDEVRIVETDAGRAVRCLKRRVG